MTLVFPTFVLGALAPGRRFEGLLPFEEAGGPKTLPRVLGLGWPFVLSRIGPGMAGMRALARVFCRFGLVLEQAGIGNESEKSDVRAFGGCLGTRRR